LGKLARISHLSTLFIYNSWVTHIKKKKKQKKDKKRERTKYTFRVPLFKDLLPFIRIAWAVLCGEKEL